jgi:hypothetical protein
VRSVGPDGIMRNVSGEGRVKFGAPTRVAFASGTQWLYVADASNHLVVALNIPPAVLGPRSASRGAPAAGPRGGPIKKIG